jgi:chromosome segregation ATPase
MPSNQDLIFACDRALAGIQEVKANAVQLQQLAQQIREAQSTLAGLHAEIAQARPMAAQIEELDQRVKLKRHELAELELQISKKSVEHGTIDAELGALVKRARSLVQTD